MSHELRSARLSNGLTLQYATQGDPAGTPVVFLHGVTDSWRSFEPLPQTLRSIRYNGIDPLGTDSVKECIAAAESDLAGRGRLLVRKSGTEPKIRVMVEGEDDARVSALADHLAALAAERLN